MSTVISMDAGDFDHLCHTSMAWAELAPDHEYKGKTHPGWRQQVCDGRFELNGSSIDGLPSMHWKQAYWLGEDYTAVILARSFLSNLGFDCQVVWDLAENPHCSWVILTDYERKQEG